MKKTRRSKNETTLCLRLEACQSERFLKLFVHEKYGKEILDMAEFWESSFIENQSMWGFEPSDSAIITKDFFLEKKVKDLLIAGVGYGRNAKVFTDNEISVTVIGISKTAIELAKQNNVNIDIFHGSVTAMPFDQKLYDGIFCYALIHLLNHNERVKFIKDCYNQLKPNGY